MEWLIALLGVVVGALCTYFLTLARDRRQEAQREAVAMFELQRKCEELKLHTADPDIFDTAFFRGMVSIISLARTGICSVLGCYRTCQGGEGRCYIIFGTNIGRGRITSLGRRRLFPNWR